MKKLSLFVICLGVIIVSTQLLYAENYVREVRGVWVTNVDSDMLFSHEKLVEKVDYLARTGFNVIYPVVWNKGMTLYPSRVMDTLFQLSQDTSFARQGRDPLAELITEAHRHGMEVIPWFEFGFSCSHNKNGGHIIAKKPEWAALDKNGKLLTKNGFEWMDAMNPEVQDFILALIMEIIVNYDIDGIQGDDRLPAMPVEGGYSSVACELFRRDHDGQNPPDNPRDIDFVRWKAHQLNEFTRRMYRMIKAADNHLIVSLAPNMYSWAYLEYLQDSRTWLDSLYCDQYIPQIYRWKIDDYKELTLNTYGDSGRKEIAFLNPYWKNRSIPGIIIKAGNQYSNQHYVLEAVRFNRSLGIAGESFFFFEGLGAQNNFLADTLHKYVYQKPALLPYRYDYVWRPEGMVVHAEDNQNVIEGEWITDSKLKGYDLSPVKICVKGSAKLIFNFSISDPGLYDIYYHVPRGVGDKKLLSPNQIQLGSFPVKYSNSGHTWGWQPVGTMEFKAGNQSLTALAEGSIESPAYADAIMLMVNRRHSRQTIIKPR